MSEKLLKGSRKLPKWVEQNPKTAERIKQQKIGSIRQLEIDLEMSNGRLEKLYGCWNKPIQHLLNYLYALGYDCDSPEFEIIKEICSQNSLQEFSDGAKLNATELNTKPKNFLNQAKKLCH